MDIINRGLIIIDNNINSISQNIHFLQKKISEHDFKKYVTRENVAKVAIATFLLFGSYFLMNALRSKRSSKGSPINEKTTASNPLSIEKKESEGIMKKNNELEKELNQSNPKNASTFKELENIKGLLIQQKKINEEITQKLNQGQEQQGNLSKTIEKINKEFSELKSKNEKSLLEKDKEIQEINKNKQKLEKDLEIINTEKNDLINKLAKSKSECTEKKNQFNELEIKFNGLFSDKFKKNPTETSQELIENDLSEQKKESALLQLQKLYEELFEKMDESWRSLEQAKIEKLKLSENLKTLDLKLSQKEQEIEQQKLENDKQIQSINKKFEQQFSKQTIQLENLREFEKKNKSLIEINEKLNFENKSLKQEFHSNQIKFSKLEEEIKQHLIQKQELENNFKKLQKGNAELRGKLKEIGQNLECEIEKKNFYENSLEKQIAINQLLLKEHRQEMTTLKKENKKLTNNFEIIYEAIESDPELKKKFESHFSKTFDQEK